MMKIIRWLVAACLVNFASAQLMPPINPLPKQIQFETIDKNLYQIIFYSPKEAAAAKEVDPELSCNYNYETLVNIVGYLWGCADKPYSELAPDTKNGILDRKGVIIVVIKPS